MRRAGVHDPVDGQVEMLVVVGQAGERGRDDGDAVVALHPADDLLLLRLAAGVVIVPGQLDLSVIRLGPGRLVDHFRHRHGRDVFQFFGQLDGWLKAAPTEKMVVGQLVQLLFRGVDQLSVAKTEARAPKPRHAFDIALAVLVVDIDALARLNDMRAGFSVLHGVGIWVQQGLNIAGLGV